MATIKYTVDDLLQRLVEDNIRRSSDILDEDGIRRISSHDLAQSLRGLIPSSPVEKRTEYVHSLLSVFGPNLPAADRRNVMYLLETTIPTITKTVEQREMYSKVLDLLLEDKDQWVRHFGRRIFEQVPAVLFSDLAEGVDALLGELEALEDTTSDIEYFRGIRKLLSPPNSQRNIYK